MTAELIECVDTNSNITDGVKVTINGKKKGQPVFGVVNSCDPGAVTAFLQTTADDLEGGFLFTEMVNAIGESGMIGVNTVIKFDDSIEGTVISDVIFLYAVAK